VLPIIAEVVDVEKTGAFAAVEVKEAHSALIEAARIALEFRLANFGINSSPSRYPIATPAYGS
jgi:hypothetical protein